MSTRGSFRRQKTRAVWDMTGGLCWYCGVQTRLHAEDDALDGFCIEHQTPWSDGGTHALSNLVPACRSCNARKGTKSLEGYRAWVARQSFPHFTAEHIAHLEKLQIPLPPGFPCYPPVTFWGEEHGTSSAHEEG
jgi:5-methylcytosine-specific restriction endonuclease McrA